MIFIEQIKTRRKFLVAWLLSVMVLYGQKSPFDGKDGYYTRIPSRVYKTFFDSTGTFDVLHYRFNLTFPFVSNAFFGSVTLNVRATEILSGIELQMGALTIDQIHLRGETVSFQHSDETLSLTFPQTIASHDTFTLSIRYHGAAENIGLYFQDRCEYTMAEPEEARYWFPGHDVPWDKATAELFITVPAGVEVASVGLLRNRTLSKDGLYETFHWATQYQIATYLICITMSDEYAVWSDWFVTADGDSIEMPYYVFVEDSAKSRVDVRNMGKVMDFFTDVFGKYPFEKYGTATVTEAWFDGMEHQTMTTVVQTWFQGNGAYETGFVHELAHMWWGDAVTLNDWPAIWLNEGFATYSELLFREYYYGKASFQSSMQYYKEAYINQTESFDFPIYDPPRGELFNTEITYWKGAWVLHMLRHVVGEEAFWQILPSYYDRYKYGNASISEFQEVCESISGMELDWFFEAWIYRAGYMKLIYDWAILSNSEDNTYHVQLQIEQVPPIFKMPLDIQIQGATVTKDTTVMISELVQHYSFRMPEIVHTITLDPEGWVMMTDSLASSFPHSVLVGPNPYLYTPFPNPFNRSTIIQYILPPTRSQWSVNLSVFNIRGQKVLTLIDDIQKANLYSVSWDGRNKYGKILPSGIYMIMLEAESIKKQQKVIFNQ